jgi:hypothetical protein
MIIRTYSGLLRLNTFEERYEYLRLDGTVGKETFGFDRFINQRFYKSLEWKRVRDIVIVRDDGCDMGVKNREIQGKILIHHMNPISLKDIMAQSEYLLNPEYLISTSGSTHNAIHYGDEKILIQAPAERSKNDTCPWRH